MGEDYLALENCQAKLQEHISLLVAVEQSINGRARPELMCLIRDLQDISVELCNDIQIKLEGACIGKRVLRTGHNLNSQGR